MTDIRGLVAGNWKMNGVAQSLSEALAVGAGLDAADFNPEADVMLCPPATLVAAMAEKLSGSKVSIGGQDCHANETGAHTGDISAEMLKDAGAQAVIVGHSERRADHGETDGEVFAKGRACHRAGLTAIVCVGETEAQRRGGEALDVVTSQIRGSVGEGCTAANTIIAYEPVWAIGSGLTPTIEDVGEMHGTIREVLGAHLGADAALGMRILYGGSVKPANARELMSVAHVNGALVGGASLKAEDFLGIIEAYC